MQIMEPPRLHFHSNRRSLEKTTDLTRATSVPMVVEGIKATERENKEKENRIKERVEKESRTKVKENWTKNGDGKDKVKLRRERQRKI